MIAQRTDTTTYSASRTATARYADAFRAARDQGYTLAAGYENQGGYWLSRADALNSMARWLPDLDAVENALDEVGK